MLVCTNAGIGAKAINIKCITILYKLSYFEVFIAANSAPRDHVFYFFSLVREPGGQSFYRSVLSAVWQ